nr:azurin [Pseudomonas fluorescens]
MNIKPILGLTLIAASAPSFADQCAVDIDSTDQMTFSKNTIEISKSCKTFTINLGHSGSMAKTVMGHNLVVSKASDQAAIAMDGMSAGVEKEYLKQGDNRIIAKTKLIGAGEKTSTSFDVAKVSDGTQYVFFCSFPGHASLMRGDIRLID